MRRGGSRAGRTAATALVVLVSMLAGCGVRTVGPARTYDDYERKARTSVESALSAVETVQLLATTAAAGDALGPYTSVSVSEQEDAIGGVRAGFTSIQPPDDRADDLRGEVVALLDDAHEHVADVRIAARRGELDGLDELAAPLAGDADALRAFLEANP